MMDERVYLPSAKDLAPGNRSRLPWGMGQANSQRDSLYARDPVALIFVERVNKAWFIFFLRLFFNEKVYMEVIISKSV